MLKLRLPMGAGDVAWRDMVMVVDVDPACPMGASCMHPVIPAPLGLLVLHCCVPTAVARSQVSVTPDGSVGVVERLLVVPSMIQTAVWPTFWIVMTCW